MPAVTLQAEASLTMRSIEGFRSKAREILLEQDLVLDLADIQELDSSVLACLFDLNRLARSAGHKLDFVGMPDGLRKLAEVYGVVELLPEKSKQV